MAERLKKYTVEKNEEVKGKALIVIKLFRSAGKANSTPPFPPQKKRKKKREWFTSETSPKMSPLKSRSIGEPISSQSSLILPHMPLNYECHERQLSTTTRISRSGIYVLPMEERCDGVRDTFKNRFCTYWHRYIFMYRPQRENEVSTILV